MVAQAAQFTTDQFEWPAVVGGGALFLSLERDLRAPSNLGCQFNLPARSAWYMKQDFLSCYVRLAVLCSATLVIVLAIPPSYRLNLLDDPVVPRYGEYLDWHFSWFDSYLGSKNAFRSTPLNGMIYRPLSERGTSFLRRSGGTDFGCPRSWRSQL